MSEKQLLMALKELHLPAIRQDFEEVALIAQKESLSYEKFLLELVERELISRQNRRRERNLKLAKLPALKTLSNFDLKRIPISLRQQFRVLQKGEFTKKSENVLIFGNSGSGKTHLAAALGYELVFQGQKVYFRNANLLVQDLLIAKRDLRLAKYLNSLDKFDLIIIDDLGYVQQEAPEMEVLFNLFAQRYESGSLLITSNLPFSGWNQIFKNESLTVAVTDRLIHHSTILEMNLPSFRLAESKKRKEKKSA